MVFVLLCDVLNVSVEKTSTRSWVDIPSASLYIVVALERKVPLPVVLRTQQCFPHIFLSRILLGYTKTLQARWWSMTKRHNSWWNCMQLNKVQNIPSHFLKVKLIWPRRPRHPSSTVCLLPTYHVSPSPPPTSLKKRKSVSVFHSKKSWSSKC